MTTQVTGSCLCGNVSWEIDGPLQWMGNCHCTFCRKSHGTAFATFVTFPASGFRWTRGADHVRRYESSPGTVRNFCDGCGSKLPATEPFGYAPAGALRGEITLRPGGHMFATSKAPWHDITDDAPRFDAFPPVMGASPTTFPTPRHTEPARDKIRGSCLCGAAAYEVDGPFESGGIVCCHCSRCRAASGSAHGTNIPIEPESFRWLRGADAVATYRVEGTRFTHSFCTTCGSPMPAPEATSGRRMIRAGSLDDDPGVRAAVHIQVASKASWHLITDKLPQHAEYPPPEGFPPVARTKR